MSKKQPQQLSLIKTKKTSARSQPSQPVQEALEMQYEDARESGQLGYMARVMTCTTLPHSDPKTNQFTRENGDLKIVLTDTHQYGLPYGVYPRLILAWLTTEAVKTKRPKLYVGRSFAEFLDKVNIPYSSGTRGSNKAVRDQMQRLFGCTIVCMNTRNENADISDTLTLVDQRRIWWHPRNVEQMALFKSHIVLSDVFFNEIIDKPVPIDFRALRQLKDSSLSLDIYTWLTYRMFSLRNPTAIPFEYLQWQFGSGYSLDEKGRKNFTQKFKVHMNKVSRVYPQANYDYLRGRLLLKPSPTHIAKR